MVVAKLRRTEESNSIESGEDSDITGSDQVIRFMENLEREHFESDVSAFPKRASYVNNRPERSSCTN